VAFSFLKGGTDKGLLIKGDPDASGTACGMTPAGNL